jgi:hypothetical protein
MLGAQNLPDTLQGTQAAIQSYFPELHYGERTQSIIQLLDDFPSDLKSKPFVKLISKAGFINLPDWVYPMIGKRTPIFLERLAIQKSIDLIAIPVRQALKDGVAAHSLRRVYG